MTGVNSPGTTDLYFDYDSFQEVEVSTGSHKAEVGTPGVYINMVSKVPTDKWHGMLQESYSNSSLESNNVNSGLRSLGITSSSGIDMIESFSAQAGGPITNKLRVYFNYRYDKVNLDVLGFPLKDATIIGPPLVNATYQVNASNRINAFYTYNKYNKPHRGASALTAVGATGIEDDHTTVYGVDWTSTLNNRTVLDNRVGYIGQAFDILLQPGVTQPATTEVSTGYISGARTTWFMNDHLRLQLSGFLSYYRTGWFGASHDIKIGYDVSRGPNQAHTFAYDNLNLFTSNGQPFEVEEYNTPALTRALSWFYPLYAQDTITRGRTTISIGVRYDGYSGTVSATSVPGGTYAPLIVSGPIGPNFQQYCASDCSRARFARELENCAQGSIRQI